MNTFIKTLTFITLFLLTLPSHAQFGKKLGQRIKERITRNTSQKIEDKAAEKADKTVDNILSLPDKNQNSSENSSDENEQYEDVQVDEILQGMLGGKKVTTRDSYTFDITATMEVENYEEDAGVHQMTQSYGKNILLTDVTQTGVTKGGLIIHDFEHETAVMLDEDKKIAQAMSLGWMKKMMGQVAEESASPSQMTKTGKTRTINGYRCEEYLITHDEGKMYAWFAPDVDFSYSEYLSGFTKMFGENVSGLSQDRGYVMEMTGYDVSGEKIYRMAVTALSETPRTISLSAYDVQKLF